MLGLLLDAVVMLMAEHPAFIGLPERRDVDPVRKAANRGDMLERVGRLIAAPKCSPAPWPFC